MGRARDACVIFGPILCGTCPGCAHCNFSEGRVGGGKGRRQQRRPYRACANYRVHDACSLTPLRGMFPKQKEPPMRSGCPHCADFRRGGSSRNGLILFVASWGKRQRTRTGRGPDAGRTIEFEETDADRTRAGRGRARFSLSWGPWGFFGELGTDRSEMQSSHSPAGSEGLRSAITGNRGHEETHDRNATDNFVFTVLIAEHGQSHTRAYNMNTARLMHSPASAKTGDLPLVFDGHTFRITGHASHCPRH
eukprot:gene10416-biopygen18296